MIRRPGVLCRWAICDLRRHVGGAGKVSKRRRRRARSEGLDVVLSRPHRRDCKSSAGSQGLGAGDRVGSLVVFAALSINFILATIPRTRGACPPFRSTMLRIVCLSKLLSPIISLAMQAYCAPRALPVRCFNALSTFKALSIGVNVLTSSPWASNPRQRVVQTFQSQCLEDSSGYPGRR